MRDVENEEFGNNGGEQLKLEACVLGNERFQREVKDLMFLGLRVTCRVGKGVRTVLSETQPFGK